MSNKERDDRIERVLETEIACVEAQIELLKELVAELKAKPNFRQILGKTPSEPLDSKT